MKKLALLLLFLLGILSGCTSYDNSLTLNSGNNLITENVEWSVSENDMAVNDLSCISFSHDSGIIENPKTKISIKTEEAGCTLAYTVNGTTPSAEDDSGLSSLNISLEDFEYGYLIKHKDLMLCADFEYSNLLQNYLLPAGKVLNVALVNAAGEVSLPVTKVYYPNVDFSERFPGCKVISITTDPSNLLDYQTGILAAGAVYDEWRQTEEGKRMISMQIYPKAETNSTQHGRAWERPCKIQIYDNSYSPVIEADAGIRIYGGVSRRMNQKSFNIYFRDEYGTDQLDYELFPGIKQNKSFSLRAGGNDTDYLKFKDAFLRKLAAGKDYLVLDSTPAILFLNGEYWGPYNLNEKITGQMLEAHFGIDKDIVVVIKEEEVEVGNDEDIKLYKELLRFADEDLSDPEIYEKFCKVMDVKSMADYCAARIYIGDADWSPEHNDVLWRTRDDSYNNGRWQYILYDTEYSSGQYGAEETSEQTNHFLNAIEVNPLFAAAIRNEDFYNMFLQSLKEIGAENYRIERVENEFAFFEKAWRPLMDDYWRRFGDKSYLWDESKANTLKFFENRYDIIIPYVEEWQELYLNEPARKD